MNELPMVKIEKASLFLVNLPLTEPFETSIGRDTYREFIVVSLESDGITGWGECVSMQLPDLAEGRWELFSYETNTTAMHVLKDLLLPTVVNSSQVTLEFLVSLSERLRGHQMAYAALELAFWDLCCRMQSRSFVDIYSGDRNTKQAVEVGVSIGIQREPTELLKTVERYVQRGYSRIKYKIMPGHDVKPIRLLRKHFPTLKLMVDGNGSFDPDDTSIFQQLDECELLMIEQPFAYDSFLAHAALQKQISTPICLDESLNTVENVKLAVQMEACKVVNIKPGRLGGMINARTVP